MSTQMILAVVAAFSLACVFCLGLWWPVSYTHLTLPTN